jgi:hypothetical protein
MERTKGCLVAVGLLLVVLNGFAAGLGSTSSATAPTSASNHFTVEGSVWASLTVGTNTVHSLSTAYWGVNGGVYYTMSGSLNSYLTSSAISYVRYPSGRAADAYDYQSNLVYHDDHSTYSPPNGLAKFVSWCKSVHCHAILGLPAEIDNPTLASAEVKYVEQTLRFHPNYWEIGNEPAQWKHFRIAWSHWHTTDTATVTPTGFGQVVAAYAKAIHAVDRYAHLIGLPGVGTGAKGETTWIGDVVHAAGHQISAVAVHVYPAGHKNAQYGTETQFFQSLTDPSSLQVRLPADEKAIRAACSTCTGIKILATEIGSASTGSGTSGGNYGRFMSHFPLVPYVAAEVVQGMRDGLAGMNLYAYFTPYLGSVINYVSGHPDPIYYFYKDLAPHLALDVLPTSVRSWAWGVYAVATTNPSTHMTTLLVANTNTGSSIDLGLGGSGFPLAGEGGVWAWSGSTTQPVYHSYGSGLPRSWTLPAVSIALFEIAP